jgi:hypothetical protein
MERVFVYKTIVYYLMIKGDGQVSRGEKDKCPDYVRIYIVYLLITFE